jgi:xanthine dehydrogenase YagR molybdenum-binding subunit
MPTAQESSTATSPIGRDTPRIDGPRKVSGQAEYTSDFRFPGMLYAVPVGATIANGKIVSLDTAAAEKMPGVRGILHRGNIGKIFRSIPQGGVCWNLRRAASPV